MNDHPRDGDALKLRSMSQVDRVICGGTVNSFSGINEAVRLMEVFLRSYMKMNSLESRLSRVCVAIMAENDRAPVSQQKSGR